MKKHRNRLILGACVFFLSLAGYFLITNEVWYPKGSIKLYQEMAFGDYEEFSKLLVDDYHITEEEYQDIKKVIDRPDQISEYTIFKQKDKWIIVSKSPDGNNKIRDIKIIDSEDISALKPFLE